MGVWITLLIRSGSPGRAVGSGPGARAGGTAGGGLSLEAEMGLKQTDAGLRQDSLSRIGALLAAGGLQQRPGSPVCHLA